MDRNSPFKPAALAAAALLAVSLAGCSDFRAAAGLDKIEPDEFAISTKAPLVLPPDYNLRPPAPGAAPTNTLEPSDAAQAALFSGSGAITGVHGQLSVGEQDLLQKAGAGGATNAIRQQLAADNRNMQAADQSFTNQVLFGLTGSQTPDPAVDPAAEKAKLNSRANGVPPPMAQPDTISKAKPDDGQGWLSGVFDGIF